VSIGHHGTCFVSNHVARQHGRGVSERSGRHKGQVGVALQHNLAKLETLARRRQDPCGGSMQGRVLVPDGSCEVKVMSTPL